jgi:PTS system ascorbate-specific IIB component
MAKTRVMIVCGFGLGSSMVLKMTLDDVLKEEGLEADTFCSDSYVATGEEYDIAFISEEWRELLSRNPQPLVIINNFLDKNEVRGKLDELRKVIEAKG